MPFRVGNYSVEGGVDVLGKGQSEGDEEEVEQDPFYGKECHGFAFEVGDDAGNKN